MDPEFLNTDGEHTHDTSVSSISITEEREVDLALIEDWIGELLQKMEPPHSSTHAHPRLTPPYDDTWQASCYKRRGRTFTG